MKIQYYVVLVITLLATSQINAQKTPSKNEIETKKELKNSKEVEQSDIKVVEVKHNSIQQKIKKQRADRLKKRNELKMAIEEKRLKRIQQVEETRYTKKLYVDN